MPGAWSVDRRIGRLTRRTRATLDNERGPQCRAHREPRFRHGFQGGSFTTSGATMETLRSMSAILCLTLLGGCPGQTVRPRALRPGQVGHHKTGIVFPETVAGLPRGQVRTYDSKGLDMSAGYDLADVRNPVAITVYVYPAPKLVSIGSPADVVATARKHLTDRHFELVKQDILNRTPSASLVSDRETAMVFRGEPLYGRSARFRLRRVVI